MKPQHPPPPPGVILPSMNWMYTADMVLEHLRRDYCLLRVGHAIIHSADEGWHYHPTGTREYITTTSANLSNMIVTVVASGLPISIEYANRLGRPMHFPDVNYPKTGHER